MRSRRRYARRRPTKKTYIRGGTKRKRSPSEMDDDGPIRKKRKPTIRYHGVEDEEAIALREAGDRRRRNLYAPHWTLFFIGVNSSNQPGESNPVAIWKAAYIYMIHPIVSDPLAAEEVPLTYAVLFRFEVVNGVKKIAGCQLLRTLEMPPMQEDEMDTLLMDENTRGYMGDFSHMTAEFPVSELRARCIRMGIQPFLSHQGEGIRGIDYYSVARKPGKDKKKLLDIDENYMLDEFHNDVNYTPFTLEKIMSGEKGVPVDVVEISFFIQDGEWNTYSSYNKAKLAQKVTELLGTELPKHMQFEAYNMAQQVFGQRANIDYVPLPVSEFLGIPIGDPALRKRLDDFHLFGTRGRMLREYIHPYSGSSSDARK